MTEISEDRHIDVTYLLALANRMTDEDQERGLPRGFMIIVAEGDGTFTNRATDTDGDTDLIALIGNMEIMKHTLIASRMSMAPVNVDGTLMTDEEIEAEFGDDDDEED